MEGWISIHRKMKDHWLYQEKPFCKSFAWIDLLLSANHCTKKLNLGNQIVEIEKGKFITSEIKLSERWGWSRKTVRNFLMLLESDKMIKKESTTKYTTITIENWELYQIKGQPSIQQRDNKNDDILPNDEKKGTTEYTSESLETVSIHGIEGQQSIQQSIQPSIQQRDTNNNVFNNSNKIFFSPQSDEVKLSQLLFKKMRENNPNCKEPNMQSWAKNIDKMIRIDGRNVDEITRIINWCQQDSFWHKNILSTEKLRTKFDQLLLKSNSNTEIEKKGTFLERNPHIKR